VDAVAGAVRVASQSTLRRGALEALPSAAEVRALLSAARR
jgi:sugar/nucleoside kinase (ribokinase family)